MGYSFIEAPDVAVGDRPFEVITADVNGDGKLDLLTANHSSNTVSVRLGVGDGTFINAANVAVGQNPYSVVTADVNGDGKRDLLVANVNGGTISVRLGVGDGTFTAAADVAVGDNPISVTTADVNGDGKVDLLATNYTAATVSVRLGVGNGTFTAAADVPIITGSESLTTADVNGDGKLDLLTANTYDNDTDTFGESVSVRLGAGDGTFTYGGEVAVGTETQAVTMADVNGDGKVDLLTANYRSNTVSVRLGNGNGTFTNAPDIDVLGYPNSVASADVNGDGRADLLYTDVDARVWLHLGVGDGTFASASDLHVGTWPQSVTTADINGDGRLDILAADANSDTVSVWLGVEDSGATEIQSSTTHSGTQTVGDVVTLTLVTEVPVTVSGTPLLRLNHNNAVATYSGTDALGRPEFTYVVEAGHQTSNLRVIGIDLNGGTVGRPSQTSFGAASSVAVGSSPITATPADINGDGKLDLLVANFSANTVSVRLGAGDGTFTNAADVAVGSAPTVVASADLNRDGKLDFVTVSSGGGALSVRLGNGNGTFTAAADVAVGGNPQSVEVADVNGDGKLDLIATNYVSQSISVRLGNGSGGFTNAPDIALGANVYSVAVADVNSDGRADLISANYSTDVVSVRIGNGAGGFSNGNAYTVGDGPTSITTADVNNDGKTDLLVANQDGGTVTVMLGNGLGGGGISSSSEVAVGSGPWEVTTADVNCDGNLDLLTANEYSDTVSIRLGVGDGTFINAGEIAVGAGPNSIAAADLNRDGKADLITANAGSNNVSVLLNTGTREVTFNPGSILWAPGTETGIVIAGVDTPPVARDDFFKTDEATDITGNLFADNGSGADSDENGDSFVVTSVNGSAANIGVPVEFVGSQSTVTVQADGSFQIHLNDSFDSVPAKESGSISWFDSRTFTYEITGGASASVKFEVTGLDSNDYLLDDANSAKELIGGIGNDTYIVSNADTTIVEIQGGGIDAVLAWVDFTLSADDDIEALRPTNGAGTAGGTAGIKLVGNGLAQSIEGSLHADTLDDGGGAGADTLWGGDGGDLFLVRSAGTRVREFDTAHGVDEVRVANSYALLADEHIEILSTLDAAGVAAIDLAGNKFVQKITGNAGANTLDDGGVGGSDTLAGLGGDDTYVVGNAGTQVLEADNAGTDTVNSSVTFSLAGQYIETLNLTGSANVNATGNSLANTIGGNSGNNLIDGGVGADKMAGGLGNDTYMVDNAGDKAIEADNAGTDTVNSLVHFSLAGTFIEIVNLTGTANINATGNSLANTINGNSGNNVLNGDAGADKMAGGLGNDTYTVDNASDKAIEADNAGTDTVNSSVHFSLASTFIEIVNLIGSANINATGNNLANTLNGNSGNNALNGGLGADKMAGGLGNDTFTVDDAGDKVVEADKAGTDTVNSSVHFNLAGQFIEVLNLTGSANINGTGNSLDNTISGNAGHNAINGDVGADKMSGGLGDDTYTVDNAGDTISEADNAGTDTVNSAVSYSIAGQFIEVLNLTGSANLSGTGSSIANTINGNSGNNLIDGGTGADKMSGGLGNDIYTVDNAGDKAIEADNAGTDTVNSSVHFSLAGTFVEIVNLTGSANINATGNTRANTLNGNSGNNALNGDAGADTMAGGLGNDTYVVDNASDKVVEADKAGTDTVNSSVHFNLVGQFIEVLNLTGSTSINGTGNSLANTITGNSGSNVLNGSFGSDVLTGNGGVDYFVFDAGLGASNVDEITDFTVNVDKIRLKAAIFAALGGAVEANELVMNTNPNATANTHRLLYDIDDGLLYYDADANGAGVKALFARLDPGLALDNFDFQIV